MVVYCYVRSFLLQVLVEKIGWVHRHHATSWYSRHLPKRSSLYLTIVLLAREIVVMHVKLVMKLWIVLRGYENQLRRVLKPCGLASWNSVTLRSTYLLVRIA